MNVHHYGLTVSDLERALKFYSDQLGFDEVHRAHLDGDRFSSIVDVPDAEAEVVFLDAGEIVIELFEFHPGRGALHEDRQSNDQVGAHHLALVVDDVDEWHDRLKDSVEFMTTPQPGGTGTRAAYFYDPDGNVVELVSREIDDLLDTEDGSP